MARKLTDLTQATNISADDLMYLVDAPSGAKNDRSLSMATLFASVPGNLSTVGPDPWFDVTNPAYGALPDGTNAAATTAGISAAITAASAYAQLLGRGAIVWFPPGWYSVNATLTTPGEGITLLGAESSGISDGTPASASATVIAFSNTGAPLFDLGTNATQHVIFRYIDFEGGNASNILSRCIIAASTHNITVDHCSFGQWGGQAIKLDAGTDITITNNLFENCLKVYPNTSTSPGSYVGAIHLGTIENVLEHNNVNGTAGTATGHAGSGFMCAAYLSGSLNHLHFNTFAFAEVGVRMDAGILNDVTNNRFEFNQRQGLFALSEESIFALNKFQDNSIDSNSGYNAFTLGSGGSDGYGNRVIGNNFQQQSIYTSNKVAYGLDLQGNFGSTSPFRNDVAGNGGNGWNTALIAPPTHSTPLAISPTLIQQSITVSTGGTATFDAQAGDEWVAQVNTTISAITTMTIGAPTNPLKGTRVSLMIYNNSGGVLTTTFDAAFVTSVPGNPANGKFKTAMFQYDGAHWIQQGAWSGDMP